MKGLRPKIKTRIWKKTDKTDNQREEREKEDHRNTRTSQQDKQDKQTTENGKAPGTITVNGIMFAG